MKKAESATNDHRIGYISFISVVSCFAVLVLHTNGCFWDFSASARYWKTANIIECVFYFAVPLFFMLSGITLMDFYDRDSLPGYFKKRITKTVIPFLAWNAIALIWAVCRGDISVSDLSLRYLYQAVTGNSLVRIYWFFNQLFVLYLCMPLFAAVEKARRKTVFTYLVIAGFLLNILVSFLKTLKQSDLNTPYGVTVVSGVLIWPLLGWLLHNCRLERWQKTVVYSLAVLGLVMHIAGTYVLSMEAGEVIKTFKGYQNVPSVLYAAGVFVFLKDLGTKMMKNRTVAGLINRVSGYTLSIYLMQFVFLLIFTDIIGVNARSIVYRLGTPFVLIPVIMGITWCLRKIPVIRRIVP